MKVPVRLLSSLNSAKATVFPPLRHSPRQTRILRLNSAAQPSDPLTGSLEVISIAAPDCSYEALSYEWGQPPNGEFRFSLTNGDSIDITANLAAALRDLRHHDPSAAPRLLWADGICINQNDTEERQEQVAMMSDIYRQAERVVTYMGPEKDNSTVAIAAMERYCGWWHGTDNLEREQGREFTREETVAIQKLLSRGWSTRCWCALEFSLNKRLQLMCGRRAVAHWSLLSQFVVHIFDGGLPADELLPQLSHGPDTRAECIYQLSLLRRKVQGRASGRERRLAWLLCEFQVFKATQILDKIYSLMSVATDTQVPIDYTRSPRSVYVDVAKQILVSADDLTILHHSFPSEGQELPSWVPDWSKWHFGTEFVVRCRHLSPSGATKPSVRVGEVEDKIGLKGRLLGKITFLGTRMNDYYQRKSDAITRMQWAQKEVDAIQAHLNGTDPTLPMAECLLGRDFFLTHKLRASISDGFKAHIKHPKDIVDNVERFLVNEFVTAVRRRSRYSRLGVLSGEYVANVPEGAKEGDWIAMLDGGNHLYVLRETGTEGEFAYVGISYVSGLMQGEILAPDSPWENCWLTLV